MASGSCLCAFLALVPAVLQLQPARGDGGTGEYEPLPETAKYGKAEFDAVYRKEANSTEHMAQTLHINPVSFPYVADLWCAYNLEDRERKLALLIDDMQVEYSIFEDPILPQVKLLLDTFRKAGLPVFWSTWWRKSPDDGYFNAMDRFYGAPGANTNMSALYLVQEDGADVLPEVAPVTEEERRRVMHKMYSLDMFDERPMTWLVDAGQGTLHSQLQELGVDTVVQVGAWTDDCIISTAFHAASLQYDVVLAEDAVSTATRQHWTAVEVMRGSVAKVLPSQAIADYISKGQPVVPPTGRVNIKTAGGRAARPGAAESTAASRPVQLAAAAMGERISASPLPGGEASPAAALDAAREALAQAQLAAREAQLAAATRASELLIAAFLGAAAVGPVCFFLGRRARGIHGSGGSAPLL